MCHRSRVSGVPDARRGCARRRAWGSAHTWRVRGGRRQRRAGPERRGGWRARDERRGEGWAYVKSSDLREMPLRDGNVDLMRATPIFCGRWEYFGRGSRSECDSRVGERAAAGAVGWAPNVPRLGRGRHATTTREGARAPEVRRSRDRHRTRCAGGEDEKTRRSRVYVVGVEHRGGS